MKILFIVQNIIGLGTYFRAFELAKALRKLDHEVTLLTSSPELFKKAFVSYIDGVEVIAVSNCLPGPTRTGWDLFNFFCRINIIKSRKFDIVHGFESRPTVIYPALMMRRKGIPLYLDWADWFGKGGSVEERPNPIFRNILRPIETFFETHYRMHANGTTVICKTLEKRGKALSLNEKHLSILYNGFNSEGIKRLPISEAKQACGLDPKMVYIGYLGSIFQKDAKLTSEAIKHLLLRQKNIKLLHIGNSKYRIKPYKNFDNVIIETGPTTHEDLHTFLSACDIFWLPMNDSLANRGRFPLKFTDYLSHGRPIVCTDVGDVPNFVREYQTGIITRDNPEDIAIATNTLITNPSLKQNMAKNALSLSENKKHSWISRANQLLLFYKQTM